MLHCADSTVQWEVVQWCCTVLSAQCSERWFSGAALCWQHTACRSLNLAREGTTFFRNVCNHTHTHTHTHTQDTTADSERPKSPTPPLWEPLMSHVSTSKPSDLQGAYKWCTVYCEFKTPPDLLGTPPLKRNIQREVQFANKYSVLSVKLTALLARAPVIRGNDVLKSLEEWKVIPRI